MTTIWGFGAAVAALAVVILIRRRRRQRCAPDLPIGAGRYLTVQRCSSLPSRVSTRMFGIPAAAWMVTFGGSPSGMLSFAPH